MGESLFWGETYVSESETTSSYDQMAASRPRQAGRLTQQQVLDRILDDDDNSLYI